MKDKTIITTPIVKLIILAYFSLTTLTSNLPCPIILVNDRNNTRMPTTNNTIFIYTNPFTYQEFI